MPVDLIPLLVIAGWVMLSAGVGTPLAVGALRRRKAFETARRSKVRLA